MPTLGNVLSFPLSGFLSKIYYKLCVFPSDFSILLNQLVPFFWKPQAVLRTEDTDRFSYLPYIKFNQLFCSFLWLLPLSRSFLWIIWRLFILPGFSLKRSAIRCVLQKKPLKFPSKKNLLFVHETNIYIYICSVFILNWNASWRMQSVTRQTIPRKWNAALQTSLKSWFRQWSSVYY